MRVKEEDYYADPAEYGYAEARRIIGEDWPCKLSQKEGNENSKSLDQE